MEKVEIKDGRVVMKTTFSFDFDNTITRDPTAFLWMMNYLRDRGHEVLVCTARYSGYEFDDMNFVKEQKFPIYYTSGMGKRKFMKDQGILVDVWIDDMPDAIGYDPDYERSGYGVNG